MRELNKNSSVSGIIISSLDGEFISRSKTRRVDCLIKTFNERVIKS
jgi:hypothetical protein